MQELTNRLTEVLGPAGSSALGHALLGLAILIVGLFIVKLASNLLKRLLTKVPALHRTREDGSVTDFVSPIVSLVKADERSRSAEVDGKQVRSRGAQHHRCGSHRLCGLDHRENPGAVGRRCVGEGGRTGGGAHGERRDQHRQVRSSPGVRRDPAASHRLCARSAGHPRDFRPRIKHD